MRLILPAFMVFWLVLGSALTAPSVLAQTSQNATQASTLLDSSWRVVDTPHFHIVSQLSARRTETFAADLERWREVAVQFLTGDPTVPSAVRNHAYLFATSEQFNQFSTTGEPAFFTPSPRANYLALDASADNSVNIARHHYGHFLLWNLADLRLPRWYEEGAAAYLGRLRFDDASVGIPSYSREEHAASLALESEMPLDKLLFDDDALASPRLIQIANLKSESLLYFLLHGHEQPGFVDRRAELQGYLELLLEGRNHRFAFDQSFSLPAPQLDEEYRRFLAESELRLLTLDNMPPAREQRVEVASADPDQMAVALGELALYSGRFALAREFFNSGVQNRSQVARFHSGMADALRMLELDDDPEQLLPYYRRAAEMEPENIYILLDQGEYIETVLTDCDRTLPAEQWDELRQQMAVLFERALTLQPDNPEANLASAQRYLLPDEDWREGRGFQQAAFRLLPGDSFIVEQTIKYEILSANYTEAERLLGELSQPLHLVGEPEWVTQLRMRLDSHRNGEFFDACAQQTQ